jgi:pyridoxamine 5'-phosphate oxidase
MTWAPFDEAQCDPSAFGQFHRWFEEAVGHMPDREAVALVTSSPDGRPSARMVLLRHVDDHSFGWYTNYGSRKGRDLAANPHGALLWYCEGLGRQIRIEGSVERMTVAESDTYFSARPRGHQLGAHASAQSSPLASRDVLEERVRAVEAEFEGRDIPRPANWGGYRLTPTHFEFWQHRQDRLHDRVVYDPDGDGWTRQRQSP